MTILKLIEIDSAETREAMHEYKCADGTLIQFDEKNGIAYNIYFVTYIDVLDEQIDITDMVIGKPKLLRKYDRELQEHIDSWGTDEDERVVDEAKDARHG